MLNNQNIICISSIDWEFIWQGHQEIMSTFAKNGNRVLFIENTGVRSPVFKDMPRIRRRIINWLKSTKGFRREANNLYIYSPIILPLPYSRIARWFNKRLLIPALWRWMKAAEFHDPIIWTFLPTGTALDIINNIDRKLLIYYCIADFYELAGKSKKIQKIENELIKKCDLIFAQGETLAQKCARFNDNVHIFHFGVRLEIFENYRNAATQPPKDIKNIKKPIIGYVGGVHRHVDFKLIQFLAGEHPEWSLVFIGPVQTDVSGLKNYSNIFLLGKKDFSALPAYINEFDVGIIPYVKSEYTETVFPTKLNEYHAMGKPVVSTEISEVVNFNIRSGNLIFIAKTDNEFIDCVESAIKGKDEKSKTLRVDLARNNNWAHRIERMSEFMKDALDEKLKYVVNWQARLHSLYITSRRRITKTGAIVVFSYSLLFYTPLVWFMAAPLKIVQAPRKSDCIVVFAGGVGESGKPGQGYEERVQYAVELYEKGYAKNIIFSSGYVYVFEEPLVMKALALSLGVPEDIIILDAQASNTYENIKFSKRILDNNHWSSIILISSPYHMLRASMVFNKIARDTQVVYAPVPNSLFYAHPEKDVNGKRVWKRISLQQINAILREYVGIVYYWLKGWI